MKKTSRTFAFSALTLAFVLGSAFGSLPSRSVSDTTSDTTSKLVINEVDDTSFDKELKGAKLPVVVDFTAAWCGPCQALKPKLEQLASEFKGKLIFIKVEETRSPQLVEDQGVSAFPTVKMYAPGGKLLSQSVRNKPIDVLRNWLQSELDKYNKAQSQSGTGTGGSSRQNDKK